MPQAWAPASAGRAFHRLHVAYAADMTPRAAVGIAIGPGRLDTTDCKWALLVPHEAAPAGLDEPIGPPRAADRMHGLALMQAANRLRDRHCLMPVGEFRRVPGHALQSWVTTGRASREAVAALAAHLGNRGDFDWLGPCGR